MIVQAKCTAPAWDSSACRMFVPGGGPLPGGLYEIDHLGPLAALKIGSSFVFTFDRTMAGTGQYPAVGGFFCKECQKFFETINEIGTHTRSMHRERLRSEAVVDDDSIVLERRGKNEHHNTCKLCGMVCGNLTALRKHRQEEHPKESSLESESSEGNEAENTVPA